MNHPHIRFILSKRRVGPSHLRNLGLRAAEGEYVLFLDSDVVLPGNRIIHEMVIILSKSPRIGELGGEIPVYRNITDKAIEK